MQAWELYLIISVIALTPSTQNGGRPKVTLILRTQREPVYTGDTVTLECTVEVHIDTWIHRWFKNTKKIWKESRENTHIFQSVTQSDSGEYHCDAYRPETRQRSHPSNAVILNVQERTATLKVISGHTDDRIYVGDEVHLLCLVDGDPADWTYELYKSGDESPHKTEMEKNFTISPVTLSHNGEYKCRGARGALYSSFSDPVQLYVSERTATLKVVSGRTDGRIYVGDEVHLLCLLPGDLFAWRYELQKTGDENSNKTQREQSFIIEPVSLSHSGEYKCRASKEELYTNFSDPIQLRVSDFSTQNYLRLGAAGLVLIVLAIIMSKCFWNRVLPAGGSSGYAYTSL
ncbi:leukocyte immunoglobulin-like receptor subfamily A member 6 [Polypterus senegalus]|uniref:leukocyte immunoglobulin-like receptor subfamily A member 6 n=1 Tax=Polypterus senegalus TaxID=55291 RepID=UPI00196690D5|nr:leukocyte immunoglobulin-like receptor subfamily A member 6 [Polypterus senegalus]